MSGLLLVLLGLWGALIPLVGPYFHYGYTPDTAWTLNSGRVWLEIGPGAVVAVAGAVLMSTASARSPWRPRNWPRWPVPGSRSAR